jgi:hypothetical protein
MLAPPPRFIALPPLAAGNSPIPVASHRPSRPLLILRCWCRRQRLTCDQRRVDRDVAPADPRDAAHEPVDLGLDWRRGRARHWWKSLVGMPWNGRKRMPRMTYRRPYSAGWCARRRWLNRMARGQWRKRRGRAGQVPRHPRVQITTRQLAGNSRRNRQTGVGALAADDGFDFQNTSGNLNFSRHYNLLLCCVGSCITQINVIQIHNGKITVETEAMSANPGNGAREMLIALRSDAGRNDAEAWADRLLIEMWVRGYKMVPIMEDMDADQGPAHRDHRRAREASPD